VFLIKCDNCGKEVQWRDGIVVGQIEIECCGSTVICSCGAGISEDCGTLREFRIPDVNEKEVLQNADQ
jgi:hypothetical protein